MTRRLTSACATAGSPASASPTTRSTNCQSTCPAGAPPRGRGDRGAELIAAGRMRPSGLAEVEAAKADGRWAAAYESQRNATVPPDLAAALAASPQAAQAFNALTKTQQYAVVLKLV